MAVSVIAWSVSIALHGLLALALVMPDADGAALQEGTGTDIMVVEQGIAVEGMAKLGEDAISIDAVEAPPMMEAVAQHMEQVEAVEEQPELPVEDMPEVQPVQDMVLASETGPESELMQPPEELLEEPEVEEEEVVEPVQKPVEEPEELQEQPLPQQLEAVAQQTVIAMRTSSAEELRGGDTNAHKAYLGKLRMHLEGSKVNPRTKRVGTTIVRLTVKSNGELVSNVIVKSSGSKALDNAALASIAKAAPFPSIPSEVGQDTISVAVPFRFKVR
ncbi:MAG: TonB family protein [Pseudomonadota bacterium]